MVTIIVLLILAMVSVSLVIRGNIIEKANLAVTEYGKAAEQENTDLDKFESEINKYIPSEAGQEKILEQLLQQAFGDQIEDDEIYIEVINKIEKIIGGPIVAEDGRNK